MQYKKFFTISKQKGITNIQITETSSNNINIDTRNGKLSDYDISDTTDYSIKAEYNGKTVKLNTEYLDDSIIDLIKIKSDYTDSNYQDMYLTNTTNNNHVKLEKLSNKSEVLNRLCTADDFRIKNKYIKELNLYFEEENKVVRIVNNNGVDIATSSHLYELSVEFVLENKTTITNYKTYIVTDYNSLDIEKSIEELYAESVKMLKKDSLETKKYDIVLSKSVSSNILSSIIPMISSANIRQRISCLQDKIDKKVFSSRINIVEDPTNKKYPGYSKFDNEGTKTYKKQIIENGVLKTYLYDIKEAKEKGLESTGNYYGGITTRNMYIVPGNLSRKEILQKLNNGLYITDYMGAMSTSIDTNTGNISLQIFGLIVENGKIKNGFEPSVMTTSIFELLSNVEEIGNSIDFSELSSASPELLIRNISIVAS